MIAQNCSYIEHLSCNLTEDLKNLSVPYRVFVWSFVGTKEFNSSTLDFVPLTDSKFSAFVHFSFYSYLCINDALLALQCGITN